MTDEQIDSLKRRRDAGDDEADEQLSAWIEECLGTTFVALTLDAGTPAEDPMCSPECWCSSAIAVA